MKADIQPAAVLIAPTTFRLNKSLVRYGWILAAAVFIVLSIRTYLFIDHYAVNVLFWDQWDFYNPLFAEQSLWRIFDYQHGPPRLGIGLVLTSFLAKIGSWDSRWDAFCVGFTMMATCLVAMLLAAKCRVRGWKLCVIPLLFLNIRQYEMFVNAANVAHGAMPMFLFMTLLLCWFIPADIPRILAISALTFLCIFTGFSIFVGIIVPTILGIQALHSAKLHNKRKCYIYIIGIILITIAWFIFSIGYRFEPSVSGYRFPYEKPQEYLYFIAAMLNNFHGSQTQTLLSLAMGITATAFLLFIALLHGWRLFKSPQGDGNANVVVFSLSSFVLIFCINTAVGRVFLGWQEAGAASRYVTLLAPAGLAALIFASSLKGDRCRSVLVGAYAAFLAYSTVALHTSEMRTIRSFSEGRRAWRAAFLATGDQLKANDISQFQVYPCPIPAEKLEFLRTHRLNVFKP